MPGAAKVGAAVFAVVAALGCWGLWQRRRWGARTTIAVTSINVLTSLGGLLDPPSASLVVAIVVGAMVGLAVVVGLRRPIARAELS